MGVGQIIPIANGTHSVDFRCGFLSYLKHCPDNDYYVCEYNDWAYGLMAVCSVVFLLIPLLLAIHCCLKRYRRRKREHNPLTPSETSSLYADRSYEYLRNGMDPGVDFHYPVKKKDRLYFPYPAYGTFEGDSIDGFSTASAVYPPLIPPQISTPQRKVTRALTPPMNFSNSAPVLVKPLLNYRQQLTSRQKVMPIPISPSHRSISEVEKMPAKDFLVNHRCTAGDSGSDYSWTTSSISSSDTYGTPSNDASKPDSLSGTNAAAQDCILATQGETTNNKQNKRHANTISKEERTVENKLKTETIKNENSNIIDKTKNENTKQELFSEELLPPCNGASGEETNTGNLQHIRQVERTREQTLDYYLLDCVQKLPEDQRNGTFLIRTSDVNFKTLVVYCNSPDNSSLLHHFKVFLDEQGGHRLENTQARFIDLDHFIDHYRTHRSVLPCFIGGWVGKNF